MQRPFDMTAPAVEMSTLQANTIKAMLEVTKELVDTTNFIFDEEGMRIGSLDSSHVSYVSVTINAGSLECACGRGVCRTQNALLPSTPT